MPAKKDGISHSNTISLRLDIAEICGYKEQTQKNLEREKNDPAFLNAHRDADNFVMSQYTEHLHKRKQAAKNAASKSNPDCVPRWWGDEVNRTDGSPEVRGVPNVLLRSALFGIDKDDNSPLKKVAIQTVEPYQIIYSGPRLHQSDLDLWQTVIHLARGHAFGKEFKFTRSELLQTMNRSGSGKKYRQIESRFAVLAECEVEITLRKTGECLFSGGLLESYEKVKIGNEISYRVVIGEAMKPLFHYERYTQVHWKIREHLMGKLLAQWLHGYISTHTKVYPLTLGYIKEICASRASADWRFKETLIDALIELSNAYQKAGMHFSFSLIQKPESNSTRHVNLAQIPVSEQKLLITHQPSEIQLVAMFVKEQKAKQAKAKKAA